MADGANGVSGQLAIPPVAGEPNCACVNAMIQNLKMADSTAPETPLIISKGADWGIGIKNTFLKSQTDVV